MELRCPGCARILRVEDSHAGKQGKCRECGSVFTIPAANPPHSPHSEGIVELSGTSAPASVSQRDVRVGAKTVVVLVVAILAVVALVLWWKYVLSIFVLGGITYLYFRHQSSREARRLSNCGDRSTGGVLTCPNCGSAQFTAKRSVAGKVGFGLLAPKTRVKCVACGETFIRG